MSKEDIEKLDIAKALMDDFAIRTGLKGNEGKIEQRYLWTDAFAVQAYFGLSHILGDVTYYKIALKLIESVHTILGKYDRVDKRKGWISGMSEEEGKMHPTAGGLRIGKRLPERMPDEPFDENLEWERDGQYFHYITRWINTLLLAEKETGQKRYATQAAELLQASEKFIDKSRGTLRMFWKMSIDLSRPLVASMGMHDPLEGLICTESVIQALPQKASALKSFKEDLEEICSGRDWSTSDALGIGGLLLNAIRTTDLSGSAKLIEEIQPGKLISDSLEGLHIYAQMHAPHRSAEKRLAFRECGLSLGLRTILALNDRSEFKESIKELSKYSYLANDIEDFWKNYKNHNVYTWKEYLDINAVSLASSIVSQYHPSAFFAFNIMR